MIINLCPNFIKPIGRISLPFYKDLKMSACNILGKKFFTRKILNLYQKKNIIFVHKEIASRILSTNEENWNTIPKTYSEIDTLRNKFKDDKEKLKTLQDINTYIEEIEKIYQKAS